MVLPSGGKIRKVRRAAAIFAVVLAVGGGVWHASLRVPTGPAAGTALHGRIATQAADGGTIRVGTFNIHGCKGRDGRYDPDRVAECLDRLDFVSLNEVRSYRFAKHPNQAEVLGRRLGLAWLYAPAEQQWYGWKQFGNGLLTSLPVAHWQRIPLPRKYDRSFRNVLLVDLAHRGLRIHVLATHLTQRDESERRAQLRAVLALFLALEEPAILMGDLNSFPDDPQIRKLLDRPGVVSPLAETGKPLPPSRVDWIFVRGLRCVRAGIVDEGASDHPLIWAELDLP